MADRKIKRALIAVYDKTGIVDFARTLVDEFGIEIISTGGTARKLKDAGVPVTLVEQVTGFPEMLDGRVKTLHPKIHAAILADRDNPDHMLQLAEQKIEPIDMVVVNLYPFEKTVSDPNCKFEDAIEMIDIGGPCLLRAAAKNHKSVLVVSNRFQYHQVFDLFRGFKTDEARVRASLATSAFNRTSGYDEQIQHFFGLQPPQSQDPTERTALPDWFQASFRDRLALKYGENPHQSAAFYRLSGGRPTVEREKRDEAEPPLSYNNIADAEAAHRLCADLDAELVRRRASSTPSSACVFVKHTNPCGAAVGQSPLDTYCAAYLGDCNAAMGGILACNFLITNEFAVHVMESFDRWGRAVGAGGFFLEVWIAPFFDRAALDIIRTTKTWGKNVRLMKSRDFGDPTGNFNFVRNHLSGSSGWNPWDSVAIDLHSACDGMLVQSRDLLALNEDQWKVVTKRPPTDSEISDLRLAWLIAKHTKSNAISICKDGMLIGNGAGQMSRVMSCRIATWLAKENGHAEKLPGSAAASDAFFPFRDGPDLLIEAGVTAIIQPGGSKRDAETIAACDEKNVAMIFTGTRHFRH